MQSKKESEITMSQKPVEVVIPNIFLEKDSEESSENRREGESTPRMHGHSEEHEGLIQKSQAGFFKSQNDDGFTTQLNNLEIIEKSFLNSI